MKLDSQADGIYGSSGTKAMEAIAKPANGEQQRPTDQNIFDWYADNLPASLEGTHIIDLGAGIGRFSQLFTSRSAHKVTLLEPSDESFSVLKSKYSDSDRFDLIKGEIGTPIVRNAVPANTIHVCTFVVNCMSSLRVAFEKLAATVLPGERLFIVTNVFAPKQIVESIPNVEATSAVSIRLINYTPPELARPKASVFSNEILATGTILKDAVHTVDDYTFLLATERNRWSVTKAQLMLPDGFRHRIQDGEDFGDFRFAVMALELVRK